MKSDAVFLGYWQAGIFLTRVFLAPVGHVFQSVGHTTTAANDEQFPALRDILAKG